MSAPEWKETCSQCANLIRSGDDGMVWHCGAVKSGRRPVYVVTARAEPSRRNHPTMGKCGRTARLFVAAPLARTEDTAPGAGERPNV